MAGLALFGFGAYFGERLLQRLPTLQAPAWKAKPAQKRPAPRQNASPQRESSKGAATPPPVAQPKARVAIVVDDLGRDLGTIESLTAIGRAGSATKEAPAVQLSYAVLPFESRTGEVIATLRRHGAEILLHLPMDPEGQSDPGPGALTVGMSKRALAAATEAALAAVPGATGVNNHMGSRLTADRSAMGVLLAVVHRHGLYFLDSRTTAESVGFEVARAAGVPAASRDFFLDDELGRSEIAVQFARLLARAREQGAAIAIAHPRPSTLAVLAEEIPRATAAGFEFVPVSYLLERSEELPE